MSRPITPGTAHGTTLSQHDASHVGQPTFSKNQPFTNSGTPAASAFEYRAGAPREPSLLSQHADMQDEETGEALPGDSSDLQRSDSQSQTYVPSRGGTLKKKASLRRGASLSRRSSRPGSVRSTTGEKESYGDVETNNSAFYCPVPTSGNPTELLANRFQLWRKILKDLVNYFRDVQKSYETRSKSLLSAANVINNTSVPPEFLTIGGLGDALQILRDFHRQSLAEGNKAKEIENEVIMQLTGLRSDLQQKIKEIKSLSGDFKNSVDREQEGTKKAVHALQEALGLVDQDVAVTSGKGDPFLMKMGVDKQVARQIEEENYLHRAYLNLESSGRELESIVVGEIQKAYNAYAGILKREADESYDTAEKLKTGPLAIAKDHEWDHFVTNDKNMVDPRSPVRTLDRITYPGKDHPAATEIRSGMLERKSKYLKNYTPGWYILSPTHLHEFKSADRIYSQAPIMSLYLPEQKLGSHSEIVSSSHKFMLKGRQSGSMHRGHAWVFRAESHDTMMAWFSDIKALTETSGEARNAFVRRTHARSLSGTSMKAASIGATSSNDGMEEDEADHVPYSSEQSIRGNSTVEPGAAVVAGGHDVSGIHDMDDARSEAGWRPPKRPSPGGRFPSDVNVARGLQVPGSPSSGEISGDRDRDAIAAAGALPDTSVLPDSGTPYSNSSQAPRQDYFPGNETPRTEREPEPITVASHVPAEIQATHEERKMPVAAGVDGAALGADRAAESFQQDHQEKRQTQPIEAIDNVKRQMEHSAAVPAYGTSSAPILVETAAPINAPTAPRAMRDAALTPKPLEGVDAPGSVPSTVNTSSKEDHPQPTVPINIATGAATGSTSEYFDNNGVYIGPRDNPQGTPTDYVLRPKPHTTSSIGTLSDLHVPGEFPKSGPIVSLDSEVYTKR